MEETKKETDTEEIEVKEVDRIKYPQTFILPDGTEMYVVGSYQGRYIECTIQRIYTSDAHKEDNVVMSEKWAALDCKKIEKHRYLYDRTTFESMEADDTMVLAENKDWKEYPLTKEYTGEHSCNCDYYTKIEIVLMDGDFSRRIFLDWKGAFCVYDFMEGAADSIIEEFSENPDKFYAKFTEGDGCNDLIELEFYNDEGEAAMIEIEGDRGIERRIASIRVIEFTETINDKK